MDIGHPKYDPSLKDQPPLELPSWLPNKKPSPPSSQPAKPVVLAKTPANPQPPVDQKPPSQKQEYFWPAYVGGILVIAIIVFFGVRAASSLFDVWTDLDPADKNTTTETLPTETTPTAEPEAAAVAAAPAEAVPAPTPEPTPAPAAALDPATLKVRVLNGSGVPGAASAASDVLIAASIPVASTGNAKKFSYASTMIYYPAGKKEAAELVARTLSTKYSTQLEENVVADGYDTLVVVGAK